MPKKTLKSRFINCHIDSFRRYHTLRHKHGPENRLLTYLNKRSYSNHPFSGANSNCFRESTVDFCKNIQWRSSQPALLHLLPISKRFSYSRREAQTAIGIIQLILPMQQQHSKTATFEEEKVFGFNLFKQICSRQIGSFIAFSFSIRDQTKIRIRFKFETNMWRRECWTFPLSPFEVSADWLPNAGTQLDFPSVPQKQPGKNSTLVGGLNPNKKNMRFRQIGSWNHTGFSGENSKTCLEPPPN